MSGSGISWAVCKSAPRSRQITTPAPRHSVFYRPDALPATQPTASKHWRQIELHMHCNLTSVLFKHFNKPNKSVLSLVHMTLLPTFAAVAPCFGAHASGRPAPNAVDQYLLPAQCSAANSPHAAAVVEWWYRQMDIRLFRRPCCAYSAVSAN